MDTSALSDPVVPFQRVSQAGRRRRAGRFIRLAAPMRVETPPRFLCDAPRCRRVDRAADTIGGGFRRRRARPQGPANPPCKACTIDGGFRRRRSGDSGPAAARSAWRGFCRLPGSARGTRGRKCFRLNAIGTDGNLRCGRSNLPQSAPRPETGGASRSGPRTDGAIYHNRRRDRKRARHTSRSGGARGRSNLPQSAP